MSKIIEMGSCGIVTIPEDFRRDIKEDDNIIIMRNADHILIRKVTKNDKRLVKDFKLLRKLEERT